MVVYASLPPRPRVAIIVLNYRGQDCLIPCLSALEVVDYPVKDVIIVDNASRDGSLEKAKDLFPHFVFVSCQENLGFARGMNTGMRLGLERGADYLWLINNDALAHRKSLEFLVKTAEKNSKVGLLSPVITGKDERNIWFASGRINFFRMRTEHVSVGQEKLAQESYESDYLTGCALLIKKEVIKKTGFLDEKFFLYYEDADYSLRARKHGFGVVVVPAARVSHGEQSNQGHQKVYHLVYSGLLFFGKHAAVLSRTYFGLYVTIRRIKNAFDCFRGSQKATLVSRAYKDYFHEYSTFFLPRIR